MEAAVKKPVSKKVPVLRFKGFDSEWKAMQLSQATEKIGSGVTPLGGSKVYTDKGVLFIRSQNVNYDELLLNDVAFIPEDVHEDMSNSFVKPNDILLNITGASIGRSCVVPETVTKANVNQHVCIIRMAQDQSPRFIQALLSSHHGQKLIHEGEAGGGREGLSFKSIGAFQFTVPTLPEQQKIAAFLGAVDRKIQQLKRKQALLEQYKKGVVQQLFSQELRFKREDGSDYPEWEEKRLGDICSTFKSGEGITADEIDIGGEYPVYGGNGLRGFTDSFTHDGYYVLIGRQGALCGNINRVRGKVYISEHAIAVQCDKSSDTDWLAQLLTYMNLNRLSESSAQPGLAVNKLVQLKIAVPSLEEQSRIAGFLMALDAKVAGVAQAVAAAEKWKKGLLQQMFV